MRKALSLLALALSLASCFEPVGFQGSDAGLISSVDGGSSLGDASLPCSAPSDCPSPVSTDPVCHPLAAACEGGLCTAKPAPRVWDNDPGACGSPADCACQSLEHAACAGAFACSAGRCLWQCGGCQGDLECPSGQICAEVSCGQAKSCTAGCRASADCAAGQICSVAQNACGDQVGTCVASSACADDSQCPTGTVCDFTGSSSPQKACIAGCHTTAQCPTGETCTLGACPECANCPCVGTCESTAACQSDADCASGTVCGTSATDCTLHCVAGCHDDSQCHVDQQCELVTSSLCGSDVGTCIALPATCTQSSDCTPGEVCAYADPYNCQGDKQCVSGCLSDSDCGTGQSCEPLNCGPCCPGACISSHGCTDDSQCGPGQVCEGCSASDLQCLPGCRSAKDCASGEICEQMECGMCPCPAQCETAPASCQDDSECGLGMVCAYVDPNTCQGQKQCVSGCFSDASCAQGQSCALADCGPCCPGACISSTNCINDSQCGPGMVCSGADACGEANTCIPGCRSAEDCAAGKVCIQMDCGGPCSCPAQCEAASASCQDDSECGIGMVCEYAGPSCEEPSCFAGCHSDSQCGAGEICNWQQDCLTCPCPGTCESAACGSSCTTSADCVWNQSYCGAVSGSSSSCCTPCPILTPVACPAGSCSLGGGFDADGCALAPTCGACVACPDADSLVCGDNYQTYACAEEAAAAGATVLHQGSCLTDEGLGCGYPGTAQSPCPTGLYCRDTCPTCDSAQELRCTADGACVWAFDCPAGGAEASCSGAIWACAGDHTCSYTCP